MPRYRRKCESGGQNDSITENFDSISGTAELLIAALIFDLVRNVLLARYTEFYATRE